MRSWYGVAWLLSGVRQLLTDHALRLRDLGFRFYDTCLAPRPFAEVINPNANTRRMRTLRVTNAIASF
jgi:hypothetical protein